MFIRFTASTDTHSGLIPAEEIGKIRFSLSIYGEDGNAPPGDDLVVSAKFDEIEIERKDSRNNWIQTFLLSERDSLVMLERFSEHKTVELTAQFADGETRTSKIYPSGDRDFLVWAAMFKTCISESID